MLPGYALGFLASPARFLPLQRFNSGRRGTVWGLSQVTSQSSVLTSLPLKLLAGPIFFFFFLQLVGKLPLYYILCPLQHLGLFYTFCALLSKLSHQNSQILCLSANPSSHTSKLPWFADCCLYSSFQGPVWDSKSRILPVCQTLSSFPMGPGGQEAA